MTMFLFRGFLFEYFSCLLYLCKVPKQLVNYVSIHRIQPVAEQQQQLHRNITSSSIYYLSSLA
jgi:hypothetical protein